MKAVFDYFKETIFITSIILTAAWILFIFCFFLALDSKPGEEGDILQGGMYLIMHKPVYPIISLIIMIIGYWISKKEKIII